MEQREQILSLTSCPPSYRVNTSDLQHCHSDVCIDINDILATETSVLTEWYLVTNFICGSFTEGKLYNYETI